MKAITISAFMILFLFHLQNIGMAQTLTNGQNKTEMKTTTEKSAIEQLLFSYRDALNASDVSKVLPLYTKDGVFMPTNAPTAKGQEQLKNSYEFVFKTIQINIELNTPIQRVAPIGRSWTKLLRADASIGVIELAGYRIVLADTGQVPAGSKQAPLDSLSRKRLLDFGPQSLS